MRSKAELEERLNVLMQAYYFMDQHAAELSDAARVKLRVLEGQIEMIQWCLEDTGQEKESMWKRLYSRMLDACKSPRKGGGSR